MALSGLLLTVLAGGTLPVPLPEPVLSRLRGVTVTETDSERSAFTLTLDASRSGPLAAFDNRCSPTRRYRSAPGWCSW